MINYNSAQKQYAKHPMKVAHGGNTPLPLLSLFGISVDTQNGKAIGSAAVGGRAAYLAQTTIPMPALRPDASAQETALQAVWKNGLNCIIPGSQGQQTITSKGGGNAQPAPHASPGAGGANLHP